MTTERTGIKPFVPLLSEDYKRTASSIAGVADVIAKSYGVQDDPHAVAELAASLALSAMVDQGFSIRASDVIGHLTDIAHDMVAAGREQVPSRHTYEGGE